MGPSMRKISDSCTRVSVALIKTLRVVQASLGICAFASFTTANRRSALPFLISALKDSMTSESQIEEDWALTMFFFELRNLVWTARSDSVVSFAHMRAPISQSR
jgi:hypothetical protein